MSFMSAFRGRLYCKVVWVASKARSCRRALGTAAPSHRMLKPMLALTSYSKGWPCRRRRSRYLNQLLGGCAQPPRLKEKCCFSPAKNRLCSTIRSRRLRVPSASHALLPALFWAGCEGSDPWHAGCEGVWGGRCIYSEALH